MTVQEIKEEIQRLKKETGTTILVHAYQGQDVLEIADYVGDSFGLAQKAQTESNENILMCGVRFMAETCKILCPDKHVYLPNPTAGCPMAEQLTSAELEKIKAENPDYSVVAYVNTTAELKTLADACVTSSCAVEVCRKIKNDKILFIPDPNLGSFVAAQIPDKSFKCIQGGCPHHFSMTKADVEKAKALHPDALLLVHPECPKEVVEQADYVGSTTGIMAFARKSKNESFIIGTETSIVEHLQFECPDKKFYALSNRLMCSDMKATTLMDIYNTLLGKAGEEIVLDEDTIKKAKHSLDEMIRLG